MGFGWAKPGAKVTCIANSNVVLNNIGLPPFTKGEILTISSVEHIFPHGLFLTFVERDKRQYGHIRGFRPLITLEDDISMFTALTNMSPIERLDRLKEMMDQ